MITAAEAKEVVDTTARLISLRSILKKLDGKVYSSTLKVVMTGRDGFGQGDDFSMHLDAKDAIQIIKRSHQKAADTCVRRLNQLNAEVPK